MQLSFLELANNSGIADESFKKFLQTTAESGTVYNTSAEALKGYESFLQSSGRSAAIAATKTKALSFAMKAVSSVGWMMLITGVTKLVGAGFKALDKYVLNRDKYEAEALEKMSEKAQDAQSKIKSLQSEIKQNADTVDQAGKKYAELARGVNQLTGKNISLSDDEYKEFLDVSNQLADVFPQLTKGYDDNGNAILDLQGNVDGITGKLKDLLEIEQQLAQQEINKNIDTYFENQSKVFGKEAKGQNDTIDTQTEKIEKYQKALDNFNESVSNNKPASNFESELEKQTYYADFLADMEKANIDIADAIISQDGTSATEYNFAKLSKETQEQIRQYYAGIISTANTEMRSAESQLSTSNAEFASYVNMWMQNSSGSYLAMTGNDEMQSALSSIVSGLNWGDILQGEYHSQ